MGTWAKKCKMQYRKLILNFFASFLFLTGCVDNRPICQKEITTFSKITEDKKLLKDALKQIASGNIKHECKIIPPKYMQSQHLINQKELSDLTSQTFHIINPKDEAVMLNCTFYENDKLDPNKKSQSCKLYAGYLLYEFSHKNKLVYKIQIDVEKGDFKEFEKRIECVKDSINALL